LLAALWRLPAAARSIAQATLIPLAVPLMVLVLIVLLHRVIEEADHDTAPHRAAAE
jgi:hypothetical protein